MEYGTKNSDWYEEVQQSGDVLFEQFLDFNGDGLLDVIIGTNSTENQEARLYILENMA